MDFSQLKQLALAVVLLALVGCASAPKSPDLVNQSAPELASVVGSASVGDTVQLPESNSLGLNSVVVDRTYFAASGRECRRLRDVSGTLIQRVACKAETGQWQFARDLTPLSASQLRDQGLRSQNTGKRSVAAQALVPSAGTALLLNQDGTITQESVSNDDSSVIVIPDELPAGEYESLSISNGVVDVDEAVEVELGSNELSETPNMVQRELLANETLWSFAKRTTGNALNWETIARINNITDAKTLAPGVVMQSTEATTAPPKLTLSDIKQGLTTQSRVIWALILRETKTRYGEHKLGFLWAIIEPLIMVAVFVGIFSSVRSDSPGGMPLVPFMLSGIVPFTLFRDTMGQMQSAIGLNKMLFAFPQVTTFDVIIARGLLEVLLLGGVFMMLLCGVHIAGWEINIERPLGVLAACLLFAMMGIGLGFVFASISPIMPSMKQISSAVLGRPLFLGSGIFFIADTVPAPVREYLLYNPLMHILELLRSAFFYEFESSHGSWTYATTWAVCTLAFGLLTHQAMKKRAIIGL